MGKRALDQRDNQGILKLLVGSHLVEVKVGESKEVFTHYGGRIQVSCSADKKCSVYKCRHCPSCFAGDARRLSRHFLPVGLPKKVPCTQMEWSRRCQGFSMTLMANGAH